MRFFVLRVRQLTLATVLALSCGGQVEGVDAGATTSDSGSGHERTCADVGKTPAVESCCAGKYCAGSCKAIGCICFEGFSSTTCEPNAFCCPHLGCTSLETCTKYLATRDAAME